MSILEEILDFSSFSCPGCTPTLRINFCCICWVRNVPSAPPMLKPITTLYLSPIWASFGTLILVFTLLIIKSVLSTLKKLNQVNCKSLCACFSNL